MGVHRSHTAAGEEKGEGAKEERGGHGALEGRSSLVRSFPAQQVQSIQESMQSGHLDIQTAGIV
jgi:hypothetical protein